MRGARVAAVGFGLIALVLPGCWLQPGYGPESQSFNALEVTITSANVATLSPAWQVEPPLSGTPLVRGGRILLGSTRQVGGQYVTSAAALSLDDGTTSWSRDLFSTTFMSAGAGSTIVDDELWVGYLPGSDQPAFATRRDRLDVDTGDTVGSLVDEGYTLVPVEAGAVLADTAQFGFQPTDPARLTVRDPSTTDVRWSATLTGSASTPVVAHGQIYVTDGVNLHAFDAAGCGGASTCAPLWTVTPEGEDSRVSLGAATDDGRLVVRHAYTEVDRFGGRTHRERLLAYTSGGDVVWGTPPGIPLAANFVYSDAVAGDVVYAVERQDSNGPEPSVFSLRAYSTSTGTQLWTADLGQLGTSFVPLIAAGDVVYIGAGSAVLAFARGGCGASTCTPLASLPLPGTAGTMTVAQGHLLVMSGTASGGTALTAFVPA